MAELFGALASAMAHRQQGEMEAQGLQQKLQMTLAREQQNARKRTFDEALRQSQATHQQSHQRSQTLLEALRQGYAPRGEYEGDTHPAIQLDGQWFDYNSDRDPGRIRFEERLREIGARGHEARLTRQAPSVPRGSGRMGSAGESSERRETRQNFNANRQQLQDAKHDLTELDRAMQKPLPVMATSADSASRRRLEGRRDSLSRRVDEFQQLGDSLGSAMRGDRSVPGHRPRASEGRAAGSADDAFARAAQAYRDAVAGGTPEAEARARYDRLVLAISKKHGLVRE